MWKYLDEWTKEGYGCMMLDTKELMMGPMDEMRLYSPVGSLMGKLQRHTFMSST